MNAAVSIGQFRRWRVASLSSTIANSWGNASFTFDAGFLANGRLYFSLTPFTGTPSQQSPGPAGPGIITTQSLGPLTPRLLRGVIGYVTIADSEFDPNGPSRIMIGADHAVIFSISANDIYIDWRPDFIRSPYRFDRQGVPIDLIVLHHTSGADRRIGSTLADYGGEHQGDDYWNTEVESAHYIVDIDGFVVKMVPDELAAAHAGTTFWHGDEALNSRSIGIEIVHAGDHPYEDQQYNAVITLVGKYLNNPAFPGITRHRIVYHSDIRLGDNYVITGKRNCPSYMLRWRRLALAGIGTNPYRFPRQVISWRVQEKYHQYFDTPGASLLEGDNDSGPRYGGTPQDQRMGQNLIRKLQVDLADIGYSISASYDPSKKNDTSGNYRNGQLLSGVYDVATRYAVDRFKIRFMRQAAESPDDAVFDAHTAMVLEGAIMDLRVP